jgi:hypothetical protein
MECVLEKPVAPLPPSPPPAGQCLPLFTAAMLAAELVLWSWRRDSNPRPSDYKSDALPTELRQQLGKGASPRKLIPRIPSRCPGQLYKVPQRKVLAQWAAPRRLGLSIPTTPPEKVWLSAAVSQETPRGLPPNTVPPLMFSYETPTQSLPAHDTPHAFPPIVSLRA